MEQKDSIHDNDGIHFNLVSVTFKRTNQLFYCQLKQLETKLPFGLRSDIRWASPPCARLQCVAVFCQSHLEGKSKHLPSLIKTAEKRTLIGSVILTKIPRAGAWQDGYVTFQSWTLSLVRVWDSKKAWISRLLAAAQAPPPVKVLPLQDSQGLWGSDPLVLYKQKQLSINTHPMQIQNTNSSLDCVHRVSK